MTNLVEDFAARAATFRRVAAGLKNAADRAALLAIAEDYEARSERLKARAREA